MQQKTMESDSVAIDILKYKQLGEEIKNLKFHLVKALEAAQTAEKKRAEIEDNTRIKMCFIND